MKPVSKLFFCLILISAITVNYYAPVTGAASEPLIIGVPHSEEYTYATMMKNSFEMALEVINIVLFLTQSPTTPFNRSTIPAVVEAINIYIENIITHLQIQNLL